MTEWVLTPEQEEVLNAWFREVETSLRFDGPVNKDPQIRRLVELVWDASTEYHQWDNYDSRD